MAGNLYFKVDIYPHSGSAIPCNSDLTLLGSKCASYVRRRRLSNVTIGQR